MEGQRRDADSLQLMTRHVELVGIVEREYTSLTQDMSVLSREEFMEKNNISDLIR